MLGGCVEETLVAMLMIGLAIIDLDSAQSISLQLRIAPGVLREDSQRNGLMHADAREGKERCFHAYLA